MRPGWTFDTVGELTEDQFLQVIGQGGASKAETVTPEELRELFKKAKPGT